TLFITLFSFFFTATAPTDIYTLSLHDALPICILAQIHDLRNRDERRAESGQREGDARAYARAIDELHAGPQQPDQRSVLHVQRRSEEHTSELQSRSDLVCRLLLEKKKKKNNTV